MSMHEEDIDTEGFVDPNDKRPGSKRPGAIDQSGGGSDTVKGGGGDDTGGDDKKKDIETLLK